MMDESIPPLVPSTPDPAITTLVFTLLRHLLTLLGGAGIVGGLVINDGTLLTISGAIVGIVSAVWALYARLRQKRADHLGNIMSAQIGRPVQPAGS